MSEIKVNKISPRSGTDITLGDSGDNFIIPSGATLTNNGTASGFASIAWQSTIVTGTTLSAVAGNGYWIDTTSNACTITLPSSASVGDQIIFLDYARTWGTNAVTINQNSLNFQGYSSPNPVYNTSGQSVSIVYSGATQGWIPTSDDDVTWETRQSYTADFLVIAGGGAGSFSNVGGNGGGGAGGYRNSYSTESSGGGGSSESSISLFIGNTYTITVGAGGTVTSISTQTDGSDSSIIGTGVSLTSIGGGKGAANPITAGSGGSGGGGGEGSGSIPTGGTGTANQGYDGGLGSQPSGWGAGGGGAGALGVAGSVGTGGAGLSSSITGSSVARGGGGGGSGNSRVGGAGGTGGGGSGGAGSGGSGVGTSGTANTGGGGGGNWNSGGQTGQNGGSGVVILRMADADYTGTTTGSPTVNTNVGGSGETVLIFNASGSYTA